MTDDDSDAARLAELEADNRRLRRLLDQRDAPGELRHGLRNTVAILRATIRKSAQTERDLEGFVGHLEDRLDALSRAQAAADARGSIDLRTLIADELLVYQAAEGDHVSLSGPDVDLTPFAGQVLALAIHELAVNAVEHGASGNPGGAIEIAWTVAQDADTFMTLTWKERNDAALTEPAHKGFGTEVLTRMLPYELKAETTLRVEPDGLRCVIRLPLSERIGQVAEA